MSQLVALEEEMMKNVQDNVDESKGILDRITRLKDVQLGCQKRILGIQRRIHELEVQIGMWALILRIAYILLGIRKWLK